ncbi:hypothetical protein IL306_006809 [Fusarium sp. DS 682]|nr:hypothetical protein IL306_006809 [Fusarium sp. DS 682]
MSPTAPRKEVRFKDDKDPPKRTVSLTEIKNPNGATVLTNKDEICRFITGSLCRFLKPIEIPKNTHLIEHRPWNAGGIYTIRSVEPILPNTRCDLAVRVVEHPALGWVQVIFSIAGGLSDTLSLPPMQRLEVPNKEFPYDNMMVCIQIEDSIHGQMLASFMKQLDLLELQKNGIVDEDDEQRNGEKDHAEDFAG